MRLWELFCMTRTNRLNYRKPRPMDDAEKRSVRGMFGEGVKFITNTNPLKK